MVTGDVNRLSGDPAADAALRAYLAELSDRLMLGRRACADVVAEVADGLACAVEVRTREYVPAIEAAHAAILEFGPPAVVAVAINQQRLAVTTHRLGLGLLASGPAIGVTWIFAQTDARQDWPDRVADTLSSTPLYPAVLVVAIPACLLAYASAGFIARHIRTSTRLATTAAIIATLTCIVGDLVLIGSFAMGGDMVASPVAWAVVAAVASTVRLSGATVALHRLLRLRGAAR